MDFFDKLKALADKINKSKAGLSVGLKANTISTYLAKRSMPRADIAFKIAQALNVPLDWLLDDSQQGDPPESGEHSVHNFSDQELLREMARRMRLAILDFLQEIATAKAIDWQRVFAAVENLKEGDALPEEAARALHTLGSVHVKFDRVQQDFDPKFYALVHHKELPGGDRPAREFDDVIWGHIWNEVEAIPFIDRFAAFAKNRPEWRHSELAAKHDFYVAQGRLHSKLAGDSADAMIEAKRKRRRAEDARRGH